MWLWLFSSLVLALFGRRRCVVCGERVRRMEWRARVMVEDTRPPGLTLRGTAARLLGELPLREGVAHHRCVSPSDAMIQRFTEDAK